ncbi:anti-sigma factor family protein [Gimesia aquarii]|uniref:Zinc-finger domain-containing protein n=1 Tax=Gimesia aquarii TaxID=2527964 RepID=A0A517W1R1_9PLAN|nr:hypothetical protein [Gimesia aquarii]QDT99189.1 hypothetical protein V144x_46990 [Gimesia aquarii]
MSSQQPSNEDLSAYFDHEVSPEERRQLESLLENSAEARQELHEIGELSRLLQETATESAPPELAPSIRKRIEQETLLTQTTHAAVKHTPSVFRYRLAVAVSTCSSLAALVLFVLLMNSYVTPTQPEFSQGFAISQPSTPRSSMETAVKTTELVREENASADVSADGVSADLEAHQNEKVTALLDVLMADNQTNRLGLRGNVSSGKKEMVVESLNAPTAAKSLGKFSVMNKLPEGVNFSDHSSNRLRTSMVPPSQGIPAHIPLDTIRIGDVLPYIGDIDGKVAVIEVRVVDVQQALGTMELLLARNNIPINQKKQSEVERQLQNPQSSSKSELKAKGQSLAQRSDESENELFAVYVEATDNQLSTALQEFQNDLKRDQLVSLSLQPAISERSLTEKIEELPKLLAYKSNTPRSNHDAYFEAKNGAKKPTYTPKSNGAAQENRSSAKFKKTIADSKVDKDLKRDLSRSFQTRYRMQLPEETLVRSKATKGRKSKLLGSSAGALPSPESPLAASKPTGDEQTDKLTHLAQNRSLPFSKSRNLNQTKTPIKVLFVFKNSAGTPTPAAPR